MNSNIELKNHLICEFYLVNGNPKTMINETRSVVSGLDTVINAFCDMISKQVQFVCDKNGSISKHIYTSKLYPDVLDGINTFFKDFYILVNLKKNDKSFYHGKCSPKSVFTDKDGKLLCVPNIEIEVGGKDENTILDEFSVGMAHELTHIYNFYRYVITNPDEDGNYNQKKLYYNISNSQRYRKISTAMGGQATNERAIGEMLYYLNRMERNAYLGQLRQELMAEKDVITDAKSAYELVKKTGSWRNFKYLEKNIFLLWSIINPVVQKQIVGITNDITGKKFTQYSQVKKYFANRFEKWKTKYFRNASRIAYDVYLEKNNIIKLDDCRLDGLNLENLTLENN